MSNLSIFLLLFVPCIFVFMRWAYKYRNPYKLYFVFGKKGSGKSSYLAKLALQYTKKGWIVYTNVSDLRISGVRIISDVSELGDFVPTSNSVMLLDEVSLVWDNRNFKNFKDSTKEFFRLQRHYKCIVYLFSQTFDVDKKIRDLADNMYLATQFFGRWSLLREINKSIVLTDASSEAESRIAENLSFRSIFYWRLTYLPYWQKYFNSFELPERPQIDFVEAPYIEYEKKKKPLHALTKRLALLRLRKTKNIFEAASSFSNETFDFSECEFEDLEKSMSISNSSLEKEKAGFASLEEFWNNGKV